MTTKLLEKREFFRVYHEVPICAAMRLSRIDDKAINSKKCYVCIRNIGPGGLCFLSTLSLPITDKAMYLFKMKLIDCDLVVHGHIVRKQQLDSNIIEYGVKFSSDTDFATNVRLLNKWSVALKKYSHEGLKHTCSLCSYKSLHECLTKKINEDKL